MPSEPTTEQVRESLEWLQDMAEWEEDLDQTRPEEYRAGSAPSLALTLARRGADMERLEDLVREAYREGWTAGAGPTPPLSEIEAAEEAGDWLSSRARKEVRNGE